MRVYFTHFRGSYIVLIVVGCLYRVSIMSFPDYIYYKKTTWSTNIFFHHYLR